MKLTSIACLVACGTMFAQGALDVYQVTYYDNNWGRWRPSRCGYDPHHQPRSDRFADFARPGHDEFADAPLSSVEASDLGTICSSVRCLGTGRGRCDDECNEPIGED